MNHQATLTAGSNGEGSVRDLFALSDEQILEIEPQPEATREDSAALAERVPVSATGNTGAAAEPSVTGHQLPVASRENAQQGTGAQTLRDSAEAQLAVPQEPPAWLAAQMQDPWGGEEAREFWDGVQQARAEAAAYRAAIASPEDARALKELYPGGATEARAVAERARLLDDVDRAYFGTAGYSPEQTNAARAQLAQRMLREDPAAFREMVETGIRVLQEAGNAQGGRPKSLASAVSETGNGAEEAAGNAPSVGAQQAAPQFGNTSASEAHATAYTAFERAANEDLERSVGGAIERTLAQALPSLEQHRTPGQAGAQHSFASAPDRAAPLREKLAASVRAEVEKTLQGDRQLGEQVAQILSARRFDKETREQIVRLISERAQQLVPGAAKRVLNEWTQTTLAAHRGRAQRADSASVRADVAQASAPARPAGSEHRDTRRPDASRNSGLANGTNSRAINYRKLSDEQILEL